MAIYAVPKNDLVGTLRAGPMGPQWTWSAKGCRLLGLNDDCVLPEGAERGAKRQATGGETPIRMEGD